jgi:hypothetical protein
MSGHKSFLTGIDVPGVRHSAGVTEYDDPICGKYAIADLARDFLQENPKSRAEIACVLAVRKRRGTGRFCTIVTGASRGELNAQDLEGVVSLAAEFPRSVPEMLDECLINLAAENRHPAEPITLYRESFLWLYSSNPHEACYFLDALKDQGLIGYPMPLTGEILATARGDSTVNPGGAYVKNPSITVLPAGWKRISELRRKPAGQQNQAFVAMWFDPSMEQFFKEGILPAVEADGTKCQRIDFKEHNNKICDEIIAEIRRSKYLVADFTKQRGGVYFEAGFAHGLGIPVIWSVREDDVKNLHFDTRQYAHITYTTPEELRTRLLNRIRATIT